VNLHWLLSIELHWRPSLAMATIAALASVTLRRRQGPGGSAPPRWRTFAAGLTTEVAIILALYALWQLAGSLSVTHIGGAVGRGRSLWDLERRLHLPNEHGLQRAVLPHPALVRSANWYYALLHAPPLACFLLWLFTWHRDRYAPVRNVIVVLTGTCLLIQLIPVAPPRLVPSLHMVDTARLFGQSVYGEIGTGISDQLSAMPSVHIGWAALIAWYSVRLGTSRWRWLVVAHLLLMSAVVAATANHYWLDGVAAMTILALAVTVETGLRARSGRRRIGRFPSDAASPAESAVQLQRLDQ
jgi:hypothetical protein